MTTTQMSFWMTPTPVAPPDVEALFAKWYRVYPRHVAVRAARQAFGMVLDKKLATFDQLMQGAAAYVQELARLGTGIAYVKHPATWLRAGCWADEHASPYSPDTLAAARIGAEFRAARRL